MTRCKFKVESVTEFEAGKSVRLYPVHNGSKENETFYKWTPGGELRLEILNSDVAEQFNPGKEFYIDISEAE